MMAQVRIVSGLCNVRQWGSPRPPARIARKHLIAVTSVLKCLCTSMVAGIKQMLGICSRPVGCRRWGRAGSRLDLCGVNHGLLGRLGVRFVGCGKMVPLAIYQRGQGDVWRNGASLPNSNARERARRPLARIVEAGQGTQLQDTTGA